MRPRRRVAQPTAGSPDGAPRPVPRRWRTAVAPSGTRGDGWTSELSSSLALAGFLFLVFVGFTLLTMGPLVSLDAYFNLAPPPRGWLPVLHVLDRIGQRAVCLPVLVAATVYACRRHHSWRPVWLVAGGVFFLNLLMLILKVGLGRGQPETADPSFFIGGMAYPSGHTGNIVLVYGLAAWVLGRFGGIPRLLRVVLWSAVALLSALMVVVSLTLNWHWFADLIAGLLIGAMMLELTAAADFATPVTVLDRGPLAVLRQVRDRRGQRGRRGGRDRQDQPPAPDPRTLTRQDGPQGRAG